ncbi:MAG: ATP-dependent DNA ligase [Candidatus Marinimicrobia bacterium]|nr:ATP-dependent DNA ligase [Candidatus Neomarinimicrobiota bacterium]
MTFKKLAIYFSQLEATASRNQITEILADLLKKADKNEVDKICYLSLGRLAPLYAGIEFNLAEKMMMRAIAQAYQQSEEKVRKEYKKIGDLGEVAKNFDQRAKSKPLSINQVYERLYQIALEGGEGSVERKIKNLAQLLNDLDGESVKYIVRIPLGKLRMGFSDLTILDALSWMITGDKSRRKEIEEAYNDRADGGQIAQIIKTKGLKGLKGIKVQIGVPIMPALCQRLPTAEEIVKKLGKMAIEPKFDGTRLQIHFSRKKKWEQKEDHLAFDFQPKGFVRTFTRNLENTTNMFPDLVEAVFKEVKAQEAILDCEAIGYDPKTGKFLPFQETMKRKRKYGISLKSKEIPLKFFCFDVLYKDGQDLLKMPFNQRRAILAKMLSEKNKILILTPQILTENPQELRKYHDEQISKGLEGVIVKKWQEVYDPGRRGYTWVKLKQEKGKKGGGLADTLDCVVMGYNKGKGKRASFGLGAFLVGIRKGNEFLTISKIGTGLTDDQWREMYQRCGQVKTKEKPKEYQVNKNLFPDSWCQPEIVVEIEADNITRSPIHTAQYALRFPRLVRFRDDKSVNEATTLKEAEKLYKLQK